MELTLDHPGDRLSIRSVSAEGIQIKDQWYAGPLIVSARELVATWDPGTLQELGERQLDPVFGLEPEIVLVGTGAVQELPRPELLMCFYRRNIGVEFMTTRAACRTFNVLVSERRNVVAALLPPGSLPVD
jgi:uncharacterized protein